MSRGRASTMSTLKRAIRLWLMYNTFEFHRFGVSGYPTLKFFPKNNKDGEDYDGGRDVDAFVTFLNKKAGTARTSSGGLSNDVCLLLILHISCMILTGSDY